MADEGNAFPLKRALLIAQDWVSGLLGTLKSTFGALHVRIDQDYRGSYPADRQLALIYTLTTTANVESSDLSGYVWGVITISGLTSTDTVTITEIPDGATAGNALLVRDPAALATNLGLKAATALGNGTYYFALASKKLRFAKTADAGADASVVVALKSVGAPL